MHDVHDPPDVGQERPPSPSPRARGRMRSRLSEPVSPDDPAAVRAWAEEIGAIVALIRPLAEDATARKGHRVRSRRFLRASLCHRLRALEQRVGALAPGSVPRLAPEHLHADEAPPGAAG